MGADTCELPLEQEIAFSDKVSRRGSLVPSWSLRAAGYHYEYPTVASANGILRCLQNLFPLYNEVEDRKYRFKICRGGKTTRILGTTGIISGPICISELMT